jgi:serine/threonine-protein kinase
MTMNEDRQNKFQEAADQQIVPARRQCPACGLEVEAQVTSCPKDGTNLIQALEDEPAFKHRYEFLGTIGAGGMGVIYKARQTVLNKVVAIKMLHPHLVSTTAFRRFQVEGKAVGMLEHPYIISVHDLSITESGQPYMVMDFVQGLSLAQVIERDGPLSVERFLRIFDQICDALAHAHNRGVLHRDLKPSNIMLTRREGQEEVRIMDFGIAKLIDGDDGPNGSNQLTKTGDTVGSPLYMSPEQTRGGKTDSRSDLYSLGCVMYETLTGAPPFSGTTSIETMMMHLNDKPVSLSQSLLGKKKFDPDLEAMVARLLEKNPDYRYRSMEELKTAIGRLQSGKALDRFTEKAPRLSNWQVGGIAAAICACVTAAFVVILFSPSKKSITPEMPPSSSSSSSINELSTKQQKEDAIKFAVRQQDPLLDLTKIGSFRDIDDSDMALLGNATNANKLILSDAHIDDLGLEHISKLKLEKLGLRGTDVKDLHALKDMTTLQELDLERTFVNDAGLKVVAHLTNLRELNLTKTGFSNDDVDNLVGLQNLKKLVVIDCHHLTKVGLARLKKKIPACSLIDFAKDMTPAAALVKEAHKLKMSKLYKLAAAKYGQASTLLKSDSDPNYREISRCLKNQGECLLMYGTGGSTGAAHAIPKDASQAFVQANKILEEAAQSLEKVKPLDKAAEQGQRRDIRTIYLQQATALDLNSDRKNAIKVREKIRQLFDDDRAREDPLMIDNVTNLGLDYVFNHSPEAVAEPLFKEAISRYSEIGKGESLECTAPMRCLGDLYYRQKQWRLALPLYEHAMTILRKLPKVWKQSTDLRLLAVATYAHLNQPLVAERMLKELLVDQPGSQPAYIILIQTLNADHKEKEAQEYAIQLHNLSESLKKGH